jgi:ATP-dependent RNA helicase DDX24/MAK5
LKPIVIDTNVTVACIVGGMSLDKQKRMISYEPDIVIATTGRFWDLVSKQNIQYLQNFHDLSYFVLDEADRMVSQGHFPELKEIIEMIREKRKDRKLNKIQHFVCSATLTLSSKFKYRPRKDDDEKTVDQLMNLLEIEPNSSEVIDLTTTNQMARSLTEAQIQCTIEDKALYVYYFTFVYPGRTLVFTNSITNVRRLYGILSLLEVPVTLIHGELQQKQRMKNLEKFQNEENCVLISTDIAARKFLYFSHCRWN